MKDFVPYEQAIELKKLGFDEDIPTYYSYPENKLSYTMDGHNQVSVRRNSQFGHAVSAPTFSQAFRWFREKYNLRGFIGFRPNVKMFDCHIYDMSLSGLEYTKQRTMEEFNKDPEVGTYEEAELECLKKLIEIVKNK
jgi:hypothetical protein